jgi:hypothetical protein
MPARVPLPDFEQIEESKMSHSFKCNWKAIYDFQPIQPPKLTVTGECTVPTPGYAITLTEAIPQGVNPAYLLLDMTVTPPTGVEPQHITTVKTVFEKVTDFHYQYVTILPEDVNIPVEELA